MADALDIFTTDSRALGGRRALGRWRRRRKVRQGLVELPEIRVVELEVVVVGREASIVAHLDCCSFLFFLTGKDFKFMVPNN